jgi:histidinol-phosphate aminotransferase
VRERLAQLFDLSLDQVLVGNGSDEILNNIIRACAGPGDKVCLPTPTYPYYRKLLELQDAAPCEVPFPDDYSLPTDLAQRDARVTLIANPNSPSGTAAGTDEVRAVSEGTDGLVVVDEAYVDFSEGGCLDLVRECPRVVVTRTMSKSFSLAGIRLGFCFADAEVIAALWRVKEHYNVNSLSLVAAEAALDDIESMRANAARTCQTRQRLTGELRQLGFEVWESQANFVLARIASPPASGLYEELKRRGLLVRYFPTPRLSDCLRISIGTDEQIDRLLTELGDLVGSA